MSKNIQPDMHINLGGILMKNPVMTASGTFGYGPEYADLVNLNALGAVVVKGISLKPVAGNCPPRTVEVASGLINAIGLQNPGVDGFIRDYMPFLRNFDTAVIVNIWGRSVEEYEDVAARFEDIEGVDGLEVNVSCPNIKEGGNVFGTDLEMFKCVVAAVRQRSRLPLIPKLSPNVADIRAFAKAAEECGADAISLINTLPAMAIDIEARTPILGNITGGLSGPAIRPVAVKLVWEAARSVAIPVIGMGGIMTPGDALEFLIAGAKAVAIGTATFSEPSTLQSVINGIHEYMCIHGFTNMNELSGSLKI